MSFAYSLLVHLRLKPSVDDPNLLQIGEHEDFYHPDDLMALVIPPLIPVIHLFFWLGTIISIVSARIFQITLGESSLLFSMEEPTNSSLNLQDIGDLGMEKTVRAWHSVSRKSMGPTSTVAAHPLQATFDVHWI